jgi:hypothetical protein
MKKPGDEPGFLLSQLKPVIILMKNRFAPQGLLWSKKITNPNS